MKVSISLPDEDVAFLDDFAKRRNIRSRSAAVHSAIRTLREAGLGEAYEEAWTEWYGSEDERLWEGTASDGLRP